MMADTRTKCWKEYAVLVPHYSRDEDNTSPTSLRYLTRHHMPLGAFS